MRECLCIAAVVILGLLFGALGLLAAIELGVTAYYGITRWWHRRRAGK